MKGIRFYRDGNGARIRSGRGNWAPKDFPDGCQGLAIFPDTWQARNGHVDGVASLWATPGDGPYAGTAVHPDYLTENCRRISESQAREMFPNLVKRLESD
ncbi:hypothetical protein LCGC14_1889840 [marine sediment metagenome]|uniref:Uncharacterized protein n=1 Tax=marine sediment metagenome TaxID=412755 RepID=A0A0F9G017_9ZZZZ